VPMMSSFIELSILNSVGGILPRITSSEEGALEMVGRIVGKGVGPVTLCSLYIIS